MVLGYCRVSTGGQSLDSQIEALKAAGAQRLFMEKVSGVKTDREALSKLLKSLDKDSVLLVTALDRLGRSLSQILNVMDIISNKGAKFKSLREPWADSTTDMGRFLINIISSVYQLDRSLILSRTADGRKRALANNVKFGRKLKLTQYQRNEAIRRYQGGESFSAIAKSFNVTHPTISRLIKTNSHDINV
jgi:DNA invertase Pin-like site-specific DNA recombinase